MTLASYLPVESGQARDLKTKWNPLIFTAYDLMVGFEKPQEVKTV